MADSDLVAAYQAEHERVLSQLAAAVGLLWDRLPSWDAEQVPLFAGLVQRVGYAARVRLARLTDAYVAALSRTQPVGVSAQLDRVLARPRGIEPDVQWRRPFIQHWTGLSQSRPFDASLAAARERAVTMATHDAQIAVRATMEAIVDTHATSWDTVRPRTPLGAPPETPEPPPARGRGAEVPGADQAAPPETLEPDESAVDELAARRVVGYRRVLTGRSCMLCAAAATRIYRRGDLMPLHAHCDCAVAPVYSSSDPGRAANRALLGQLKKRGRDYWKQRGFVDNEGRPIDPTAIPARFGRATPNLEVGPVLAETA